MSNRGRRGGGGAAAIYAARMTDEVEVKDEDNPLLNGEVDTSDPADDDPQEDPADDPVYEEDEPEPQIDLSHEEDEDDPAEDPVADLQRQLADLKAERDAEKAARLRDDETAQLRQHEAAITNGHRRATAALKEAKAAYATAAAAGNWDAAADAQADMAQITADIRDFEVAADEVKAAISNVGKRKPAQQPKPAATDDPFEAFIAPMSEKSQAWMRTNKADLLKSQARGMKAQAAHLEAVESDIKPDTPEYFAHLDKAMGYKSMAKQPQKTPKPTGRPRVAAPAGGSAGVPSTGRNEVRLSRDEVAIAKSMGMSLKAYAANKARIIENGRNPNRGGLVYTSQQPGARR